MDYRNDGKERLSINADLFAEMVQSLDEELIRAVHEMQDKRIEESTIALKINLNLQNAVETEDGRWTGEWLNPFITYKLQTGMKYTYDKSDVLNTAGRILVRDGDGFDLVEKPKQQMTIDEMYDVEMYGDEQ